MIKLKGMTWSHDRGLKPLQAAAKAFTRLHEDVEITWDARSLSDFELFPLDQLASVYDFIMIDHPHIGTAYAQNLLLPLDTLIPEDFIENQMKNSVGQSHKSYHWKGHQWALAADAAAQFSAYRPDVLAGMSRKAPQTWSEVFELATSLSDDQTIGIPFVPIHAYSSFFSLTSQLSNRPFWSDGTRIDTEFGVQALKLLEKILKVAHKDSYDMDPIQLLDRMAKVDEIVYCPLVYGYSTYSSVGFGNHRVKFDAMPSDSGKPEGSMIGGVGLAISAKCEVPEVAAEFVMMTLDPEFQRTVFVDSSGQPGHREVWKDDRVNGLSLDFYKDTLETMDWGSMRPRFDGYIDFQEVAGIKIRSFLKNGRTDYETLVNELDNMLIKYYKQA